MRMLVSRRALMDEDVGIAGADGFAVKDERVLPVLALTLVIELIRAAASFSVMISGPRLRSRWPCPSGVVSGSSRIHVPLVVQKNERGRGPFCEGNIARAALLSQLPGWIVEQARDKLREQVERRGPGPFIEKACSRRWGNSTRIRRAACRHHEDGKRRQVGCW